MVTRRVVDARVLPDERGVVGRRGAEPRDRLGDLELEDPGDELGGVAQQLVEAARGERDVEALLLHRRPEDERTVAAWDEIAALVAHRALQQRRLPGARSQPEGLPLDRAHGERREAGELPRPRAGADHDVLGVDRLAALDVEALARRDRADALADAVFHTGPGGGDRERGGELPRVHRVVVGGVQGTAEGRGEHRLEAARGARHEPLHAEAELLAERELAIERLLLVPVTGEHERARPAVADGLPGGRLELCREGGPELGALQPELEQRPLARVGLGHRREHPGGDVGGAAAEVTTVDQDDREAALRRPPGDREADGPAADHGDVVAIFVGDGHRGSRVSPGGRGAIAHPGSMNRPSCACPQPADDGQFAGRGGPPGRHDRGPGAGERGRTTLRSVLSGARLYLVTPALEPARLEALLDGGVDIVQLRMKEASDDTILREASRMRETCGRWGVPFLLNDRPDLAVAAGADGVHVGQDDEQVDVARAALGPGKLVGLSTHAPAQFAAAAAEADYVAVGPVWATPTKPGRPAAGLDYVRHAAAWAMDRPWFAIGGIDVTNVHEVVAAGARRIVAVRALVEAADPAQAAATLKAALEEAPVGIA